MDGLSFPALVSVLMLLYCGTILIEVSIALLMGYRNKVFLAVIALVNLPTTIYYQYYSFQLFDTNPSAPVLSLLGFTLMVTVLEFGLLKVWMRQRYSWKELGLLVPLMNIGSFVVFYLLSSLIY